MQLLVHHLTIDPISDRKSRSVRVHACTHSHKTSNQVFPSLHGTASSINRLSQGLLSIASGNLEMLQDERVFCKNNSAPFILALRRVGQGIKLHNRKVKIFTYIRDFRWTCQSDITFLIAGTT